MNVEMITGTAENQASIEAELAAYADRACADPQKLLDTCKEFRMVLRFLNGMNHPFTITFATLAAVHWNKLMFERRATIEALGITVEHLETSFGTKE